MQIPSHFTPMHAHYANEMQLARSEICACARVNITAGDCDMDNKIVYGLAELKSQTNQ